MYVVNLQAEHLFQALADPTRVRIVRLLAVTGEEACLCELVDSLLEPQYKLSRHVKILRQAGLLSVEKEGRWVYHRLVTGAGYLKHLYDMVCTLRWQTWSDAQASEFAMPLRSRGTGRVPVGNLQGATNGVKSSANEKRRLRVERGRRRPPEGQW